MCTQCGGGEGAHAEGEACSLAVGRNVDCAPQNLRCAFGSRHRQHVRVRCPVRCCNLQHILHHIFLASQGQVKTHVNMHPQHMHAVAPHRSLAPVAGTVRSATNYERRIRCWF